MSKFLNRRKTEPPHHVPALPSIQSGKPAAAKKKRPTPRPSNRQIHHPVVTTNIPELPQIKLNQFGKKQPPLQLPATNVLSDGHMTPEEVERHLQSQSFLDLMPERAPPTVPTEMFSNEPSLDR